MQDPLISASLTDTVMHCLQNYITNYRTNKARHDLAFTEKLYKEAKADYEKAQKKYATFADANQNVVLLSYRAEQERLKTKLSWLILFIPRFPDNCRWQEPKCRRLLRYIRLCNRLRFLCVPPSRIRL